MAGFVDTTVSTLTKVSDRPLAILCLLIMVSMLVAELDPSGNPLKQFLIALQESISKHPDAGSTKFAKVLKTIIEFLMVNNRLSMCVSAALYPVKNKISFFDAMLATVVFAFMFYSKLTFLYIFGIAQINFLFTNSDETNTKVVWLIFGLSVYVVGVERLINFINK